MSDIPARSAAPHMRYALPAAARGMYEVRLLYAAHAEERQARVQACLGSTENDGQECRNAAQAEYDAMGIKAVNGRAVVPKGQRTVNLRLWRRVRIVPGLHVNSRSGI